MSCNFEIINSKFIYLFQNPSLSWLDVIKELDHPDFIIKDRNGLVLLFTALRLGLKVQGYHAETFPVELIYRHWTNSEAQVMFNLI